MNSADFAAIRHAHRAEGRVAGLHLDISARQWHQNGTSHSNRPCLMKQFFLKMFTWWNGQTFGTQLWTWRFGELVGEDEQGNRYYRTRGGAIRPRRQAPGRGVF